MHWIPPVDLLISFAILSFVSVQFNWDSLNDMNLKCLRKSSNGSVGVCVFGTCHLGKNEEKTSLTTEYVPQLFLHLLSHTHNLCAKNISLIDFWCKIYNNELMWFYTIISEWNKSKSNQIVRCTLYAVRTFVSLLVIAFYLGDLLTLPYACPSHPCACGIFPYVTLENEQYRWIHRVSW